MKRKPLWIFFILILSACSALPVDIIISDETPTAVAWTATAIQPIETQCPSCEATATVTPDIPQETPVQVTETAQVTAEATEPPAATATAQIVTVVPSETATPTQVPPTYTPVPMQVRFEVQPGSPVYIPNFAHPQEACNWMGIAGQVFNKAGSPMPNVVVVAEGALEGQPLEPISLTTLASAYGPGGFELPLAAKTIASTNQIFLSIYDLQGNLLSSPLSIETFDDCQKNLIVVNFKEK